MRHRVAAKVGAPALEHRVGLDQRHRDLALVDGAAERAHLAVGVAGHGEGARSCCHHAPMSGRFAMRRDQRDDRGPVAGPGRLDDVVGQRGGEVEVAHQRVVDQVQEVRGRAPAVRRPVAPPRAAPARPPFDSGRHGPGRSRAAGPRSPRERSRGRPGRRGRGRRRAARAAARTRPRRPRPAASPRAARRSSGASGTPPAGRAALPARGRLGTRGPAPRPRRDVAPGRIRTSARRRRAAARAHGPAHPLPSNQTASSGRARPGRQQRLPVRSGSRLPSGSSSNEARPNTWCQGARVRRDSASTTRTCAGNDGTRRLQTQASTMPSCSYVSTRTNTQRAQRAEVAAELLRRQGRAAGGGRDRGHHAAVGRLQSRARRPRRSPRRG